VWKASGHVGGFSDPLVEDLKTKKRYRADHLLEEAGVDPKGMSLPAMDAAIKEKGLRSPDGNPLGDVRQFNMMFKTHIGATEDESDVSYLRPETAGGIFVNFKNVVDSFHPKLPFGIGQIGKAFRNEIAPRDFIFRVRELEQMEIEYFVRPETWEEAFEMWRQNVHSFNEAVGIPKDAVHELEVAAEDRAHYSKRTIDFEFEWPFGRKELYGLAYRTDFDLKAHMEGSSQNLEFQDDVAGDKLVPHVIEPSFGVDRTVLAVLVSAYREDELGGEARSYLAFPLLKNKPELVAKARDVYAMLKKDIPQVMWDDNGNIGKRYRRQDEIGTPYCITIDFDTLGEKPELLDTVTVRNRDTGEQERVSIADLKARIG
jgi:glycyl-tRNA synthetase